VAIDKSLSKTYLNIRYTHRVFNLHTQIKIQQSTGLFIHQRGENDFGLKIIPQILRKF